jgi:alpha-galactosidase/6-phospho-beta-glucosidase family protein
MSSSGTTSAKDQSTKKGAKTPFDQIKETEENEHIRAEKEISAIIEEESKKRDGIAHQEEEAEKRLKEEARTQLEEYRTNELKPILSNAEDDAVTEVRALENEYQSKKDEVVHSLVKNAKDPQFLFL